MKNYKGLIIANVVISVFNCLVALPVLVFNAFGLWEWWHLSGYLYLAIFSLPLLVSLILTVIAGVISYRLHAKKQLAINIICFVVSLSAVLFTFFVSATWFW